MIRKLLRVQTELAAAAAARKASLVAARNRAATQLQATHRGRRARRALSAGPPTSPVQTAAAHPEAAGVAEWPASAEAVWQTLYDEEGDAYYYNVSNGETTWTPPPPAQLLPSLAPVKPSTKSPRGQRRRAAVEAEEAAAGVVGRAGAASGEATAEIAGDARATAAAGGVDMAEAEAKLEAARRWVRRVVYQEDVGEGEAATLSGSSGSWGDSWVAGRAGEAEPAAAVALAEGWRSAVDQKGR